jgi:UDP-N-acetylglucosamine acyltransferase
MADIHPSAFVHSSAQLADNVEIGPQVYIDADVAIGAGTKIMHGAHIARWTTLGEKNLIYPHAIIGHDPQDIGYNGEESYTIIGNKNIMREGFTVHRGNREKTATHIGNQNFFMVNSHVGHNSQIGNNNILVNGSLLAGHVVVGDRVLLSGQTVVHQFVRIGSYAMMRGKAGISKDLPPFCLCDGDNKARGINSVGLQRNDFSPQRIRAIKEAFKIIFRSGMKLSGALEYIEKNHNVTDDVRQFLDFILASERGIVSGTVSETAKKNMARL